MTKETLKKLIQTAAGTIPADTVIKNCKVFDVFTGQFVQGDIALCGDQIAGVGAYSGKEEVDAGGRYAVPGFIDSHIHIESSYLSPEELGRLLVPHGGTTIIADPHEIVNVCGIRGLDYMMWSSCSPPVSPPPPSSMRGRSSTPPRWPSPSGGTRSWAWGSS